MINPIKNLNQFSFGGAFSIMDPTTVAHLQNIDVRLETVFDDITIVDTFLDEYENWILDGQNQYVGLENFRYKNYSLGTTEAFDKFYMINHNKRFRCFKGEYSYHQVAWKNHPDFFSYIEDGVLETNDAVIISYPFSDTGNKHVDYDNILKICQEKNIPVLIDCAYTCISSDMEIDLSYDCITDVVFSLSKIFPIAHARVGMRFSRLDYDDTLFMYNKISYTNKVGASIGLSFIRNFRCDYITNKYRPKQIEFCKKLEVEPSDTVLFGIGDAKWKKYNRGNITNRLSFHRQLPIDGVNILDYKDN